MNNKSNARFTILMLWKIFDKSQTLLLFVLLIAYVCLILKLNHEKYEFIQELLSSSLY